MFQQQEAATDGSKGMGNKNFITQHRQSKILYYKRICLLLGAATAAHRPGLYGIVIIFGEIEECVEIFNIYKSFRTRKVKSGISLTGAPLKIWLFAKRELTRDGILLLLTAVYEICGPALKMNFSFKSLIL